MTEGKECPICKGIIFGDEHQFHVHFWDCRGFSHDECKPVECKEAAWLQKLRDDIKRAKGNGKNVELTPRNPECISE